MHHECVGASWIQGTPFVKQLRAVRDDIAAAAAPKVAVTCPFCGSTATPDVSGCCEYCGGAVNG